MNTPHIGQGIGLIGYGEVGKIFSAGLKDKPGVASAIKMCRSIMIKELEALVIESYTTARPK